MLLQQGRKIVYSIKLYRLLCCLTINCKSGKYVSQYHLTFYHQQTKFAKVMFSQVSVCPQGGVSVSVQGFSVPGGYMSKGGLCSGLYPGRSLTRGISVQGGLCPRGSLSKGVSVQGSLCPRGSLSKGFSVQGGLCLGVSV